MTVFDNKSRGGRLTALALVMGVSSVSAGCLDLPTFAEPSLVDRPRILAVVADPPEVQVGSVTQLSVLVGGAQDVSDIRWRACSLAKQVTSATQYGENIGDRGCPDAESVFATGERAEWDPSGMFFDNVAVASALGGKLPAQALEAIRVSVGVAFSVEVDLLADGKRLRALKRVLVSETENPGTNPPAPAFRLGDRTLRAAPDAPGFRCVSESGSVQVKPGQLLKLDPLLENPNGDEESWLETYQVVDARGVQGTRKEQAFYSWFATEGSISDNTTRAPQRATAWRAPSEPGCAQLWLVIRDGHGGQSACGVSVAVGDVTDCSQ
jgi:hypothetical protein